MNKMGIHPEISLLIEKKGLGQGLDELAGYLAGGYSLDELCPYTDGCEHANTPHMFKDLCSGNHKGCGFYRSEETKKWLNKIRGESK